MNTKMLIIDLDLSPTCKNALLRFQIKTVKDLCALSEEELLNIKNLGVKSLFDIKKLLEDLGLVLKTNKPRSEKTKERNEIFYISRINGMSKDEIAHQHSCSVRLVEKGLANYIQDSAQVGLHRKVLDAQ